MKFDFARVNEGNAMDLTSGLFTAPRNGTYFFSFTGTARIEASSSYFFYVHLVLNGGIIGTSYVSEDRSSVDQFSPMTLQSTLNLKEGDWVYLIMFYDGSSSSLFDSSSHHTLFTGFMLKEDIVASL